MQPESAPARGGRRWWARSAPDVLVCAGLFAGALGLRLYRVDHQNFWIDEVYQQYVAARPVSEIVSFYSLRADGGLLSLLVSHVFLSPTTPELMARLPSVAFGTGAVVATALVGRAVLPARVAWLGAAFLAVSPLHVWYSQEARWYAQWVFLTTISYVVFVRAMRRRRWLSWLRYAAVTVLDLYTFVLSFVVIACQAVSGVRLARRPGGTGAARWIATQAAILVVGAPLVAMIVTHLQATTGSPRPNTLAALPYTVFTYAAGFSLGPTVGELHTVGSAAQVLRGHPSVVLVFAVFVPILVAGIVEVARDPEATAVLVPWLLGPTVLVFFLTTATQITYEVRYTLVALPAFALVLAAGVWAMPRPALRALAGAAVFACAGVSLANHYWNPRYAKEDVRAAVGEAIRREPHAPIVVLGQGRAAVWFYANGAPIERVDGCEPDFVPPSAARDARLAAAPVLWVVRSRDWSGLTAGCAARLLATHERVEQRSYPGVELWRMERRRAVS